MRLLLVEDNHDLRRLFALAFSCRGIEVCQAADGMEALSALEHFDPEVIVTDMMMPDVDGLELTRLVRATPRLATVPIVVMSAAASEEVARELIDAGASAFLAKPVDAFDLADRLTNLHHRGAGGLFVEC